ncbi:MAG: hypothetical protein F4Y16_11240 [Holophagales bacterium]|nr:hypothetical protein [Holophagales bacterium]MYH26381.1 hypothetical protein [Holophagales bacterium]
MQLADRIASTRRLLEQGTVANEAAVRQGIVNPLLRSLDWDTSDVSLVRPEYPLKDSKSTSHADYALFSPEAKAPKFLIEVKQVGSIRDHSTTQVLQYAFVAGTALVALTDGRTWSFFLPLRPGNPDERHVRTIDLLDDDPSEACDVLSRYLQRSSVQSDQAHRDAELDWEALRETAKLRTSIEAAWKSLRNEPHADLVGLIARETERRAHKLPDRDMVEAFIRGGFRFSDGPSSSPAAAPTAPQRPTKRKRASSSRAAMWMYKGQRRSEKNASDMYVHIIEQLRGDHGGADFYVALQQRIKGRKRANIGRSPEEADPRQHNIRKLPGGWYLSTHLSNAAKLKCIRAACEVSGVVYGRDLTVFEPAES